MEITMDMLQTVGVASLVFLLGRYLRQHVAFFEKYFIPAPVIGGLLFSIIVFALGRLGWLHFNFDNTLQDFFMNLFFTCTGFTCSWVTLKKSGKLGLILAIGSVAFLFVQNLITLLLSGVFDISPLIGLTMGSMSMSGGVGSGVSFGPMLESMGQEGATTIAVAAATFGLLLGSVIGGPVAHRLIKRYQLQSSGRTTTSSDQPASSTGVTATKKNMLDTVLWIMLGAFVGVYINKLLALTSLTFPYYVGCLFGGAVIRNIMDMREESGDLIDFKLLDMYGGVFLNLFLSMALMTLDLQKLMDLALPMVVILLTQAVAMAIWASIVTFRSLGKDYEAAVMAAGHCGVALGQTPNAIANMSAVIEKSGPAPTAWFVLPVVTVIFINISNPIIITFFINWVK